MRIETQIDYTQAIHALSALPGALGGRVAGKGLQQAAKIVAGAAKQSRAFQDHTGRLRRSIRARRRAGLVTDADGRRRKVPGARAAIQAGGPGARHAHLVERGHGGPRPAPAHPYLLPALDQQASTAASAARRAMAQEFGRVADKLRRGALTTGERRLADINLGT